MKGIMLSMITIINLYLDDVYGNNMPEDIFTKIYRRYLHSNNCCPFLEQDFPLAFNEFFKSFNFKPELWELFSDIYWDSVFKYKDLCDVFLRSYKNQSAVDGNNNTAKASVKKEKQDTMNKIIDVLWKCMSPLKKQISEKLKIYEHTRSSNIELSEFIMKQKQSIIFDYSNINDISIQQVAPSPSTPPTQLSNVNNVFNSNNGNTVNINETTPNNINTTILNSNITDNSTNISWEGGSEEILEGDEIETSGLLTSIQTAILTETSRFKANTTSLQEEPDKKETNIDCISIETNNKKAIQDPTSLFSTSSITNKINRIGFMGCIKGNSFYTERFNTDDYKNLNCKYDTSLYKNNTPSSNAKQLVNSLLLDNNSINTNDRPSCIYNISTSTSSPSNSIPPNQATSLSNAKSNAITSTSSGSNIINNMTPIELGYAKTLAKKSKVDFFQHIQTLERETVKEDTKEDTRTNEEIINDINTVNESTRRNAGKKKNKRKHKKRKQFAGGNNTNNGEVNNNNIINTGSSKSKSCFDNDVDLFKNALSSEQVYAWQTQKISPSISPQWIKLIS